MGSFIAMPFLLIDLLRLDALHSSLILVVRPGSVALISFFVGELCDRVNPTCVMLSSCTLLSASSTRPMSTFLTA